MSGLNCKPGDLALAVFGSASGLTCEVMADGGSMLHLASGEMMRGWIVDFAGDPKLQIMNDVAPASEGWYPDAWLRPIRDQPGEDEMLRIAGKPQDQREPA